MKQLYHSYLATVYAFTYHTNQRRLLGFALSTWVRALVLAPLLVAWTQAWPTFLLAVTSALFVWVMVAYWRARRAGYAKFVPDLNAMPGKEAVQPLPDNQRVRLQATGIFTVNRREGYLLLRPAEYWRVPRGEHVVMARTEQDRFLYQFFSSDNLQQVQSGRLLFGKGLPNSLAVTFLQPKQSADAVQFDFSNAAEEPASSKQKRTIYLTFEDAATHQLIWHQVQGDIPPSVSGV